LRDTPIDRYHRTLAFIFHQGRVGQSARDRKRYIYQMVTGDTDWQNFTADGLPLTLNQELLMSGNASFEVTGNQLSLPGQGIELSGQ
jgi:hypothetical protein